MIKKTVGLFFFIVLMVFNSQAQKTKDFYVSPKGSDKNPGSIQKPFYSLEKAKAAVRAYLSSDKNDRHQAVTVYLRGGIYSLDSAFVLRAEDSGEKDAPIIYRSYSKEIPVIDGGQRVTGWKPLMENLPEVGEKAKGKLWVANIPKGWLFHYLYINGKMGTRSQSNPDHWRKWNKDHVAGKPEKEGQQITFANKEQLKYLPSNGDAEMVCIMVQYGIMGNGVVTDVDPEKGTLRWNSHQVNIRASRNASERGYRFENALCFIDTPGEWAVDSKAGKVYYYPEKGEDLTKDEVIAPRLYELVRFQGDEVNNQYVHDVEFRGITFMHTDRLPENQWPYSWLMRQWENVDATIYMTGTRNCSLIGNRILYSGAYGITINHFGQQNRIEGNEIGYTGSGGIFLEGYGPGILDVNKGNTIIRNHIHDHGLGNYWHSPCIQIYQSGENLISHNLLQRSAYSAISIVGADPGRMSDPAFALSGTFDGQAQRWNMFNIRLTDFPEDIQNGIKNKTFKFDRETIKPYIHSNSNMVECNVVVEPEQILDEGGAIYAWCVGKGNCWCENIVFKSSGFPGASILALDDLAEYFTVTGNVIWVNGVAGCGTIGVRPTERGNTVKDNIRACFKPEHADKAGGNMDGISLGFYRTETGRESVYALLKKIQDTVNKNGGWPGNPKTGVPGPNEPVKASVENKLPEGSHKTIE
jgi:hypothetical protein